MNKALLIIDMQLMPFLWKNYSGKEIYNEQKLLDNTQKLIEKARICEVPVYYILFTEQVGSMRAKTNLYGKFIHKLHQKKRTGS